MMRRRHRAAGKAGLAILVAVILLWTLFPVYWMVSTSLKSPTAVFYNPPELFPAEPTAENYGKLAGGTVGFTPISRFFANSSIVSGVTIVVAVLLALFASYGLSRFSFRLKRPVLVGVLISQMFPLVVMLTPLYILYIHTGMINTYRGLVIAFTGFTLPFCIWMLKSFMDTIPRELDEAAIIEGCSRLGVLRRVVLPLLAPGLAATGIFAFLDAWNNLLFPMSLTTDVSMKTLPPGMILAFGGEFKHDWGGMMAASVLVALPVVAVMVFLQKYLVSGLTAGSVKD
ncbi:MAG: carbohydrate ABC transporter permease [Clostridiales Family XIII bacterium]|jgi:multiple sugar transport system permease protein|nr:carbohydrate ABC transporter permease [Clostridiales Family XIII bacterium]